MQTLLRRLPQVDQLLNETQVKELLAEMPRRLVLTAIRQTLDQVRAEIMKGPLERAEESLAREAILAAITDSAHRLHQPSFRRVVNATGIIIHTNLGRSLMPDEALDAVGIAGKYYSNLEYNLESGRRGSRYSHVEGLLCDLTGAEAGLVVNNNAAAVLLALSALAKGREVIVSRGELVEIGGSFRIPEVMNQSGAVLIEVGATNKTHLADYERAITEQTALLLKVHQSNFRQIGFTAQVDPAELVVLGRSQKLPVMEDLGSGSLIDFSPFGLTKEPTVKESIAAGLDVVTFSGDKLLGGPQAGLIIGRHSIIELIKKHPLNRALRIDKFTLAGLEACLRLYLDESQAIDRIPTLKMITTPYPVLRRRAARLKRRLALVGGLTVAVDLADGYSQVGGGSLPEQELKTRLVTIRPLTISVNRLEARLREFDPPIIGRIENDLFILDVRTMTDEDFEPVSAALGRLDAQGRS